MNDLRVGSVQESKALADILKNWEKHVSIDRDSLVVKLNFKRDKRDKISKYEQDS